MLVEQSYGLCNFQGYKTSPREISRYYTQSLNCKWFCQVLAAGEGELSVVQRPTKITPVHAYLPCHKCHGFYSRQTLYQHTACCGKSKPVVETSAIVAGRHLLLPLLPECDTQKKSWWQSCSADSKKPLIIQVSWLFVAIIWFADLNNC